MNEPFTKDLVLSAYSQGIFPMGHDDGTIRWYSPDPRCIFDFDKFHVPRRLMRTYKSGKFEMKVNSAWNEVLKACADRESTWITDDIFRVYTQMHEAGFAHSVEAYYEGRLAGGLYGVSIGGAFMGESMFHNVTDASKISLIYLVERLQSRGFVLLDSQYMTDHLSTLGAVLISRQEYLRRLDRALYLDCRFD
ncbi:MAG TPA: leucyl/phenylalanyl-tRNA--protein transferase [Candidatus Melainabacteria bacterium]|nr:leucyl/phenylalanyl-tRNA--protein transferase [Candidatus Melainabacteria bacterium]HMP52243.1 leucyl/phenylalanyl-tRNA--protein transferase [Candidatus Melainabacteria bacterium]